MDVEALLEEDEDDVLEDIDMSQPVDSSQDLVDFEDMTPVPSPAKSRETTAGVPTPGRAGAPSRANAAPPIARVGEPGDVPGVESLSPDAPDAMDAEAVGRSVEAACPPTRAPKASFSPFQVPFKVSAAAPRGGDASATTRDASRPLEEGRSILSNFERDAEMRDQHTFVPLEPSEVRLAERICRRVAEPKKHLVRLLVGAFGSALAEGALRETERAFEADRERRRSRSANGGARGGPPPNASTRTSSARPGLDEAVYFDPGDGGPPRRRTPGGAFIAVFRARAPEKEFKAVLRRSAEIDKLLRKQMEARDGEGGGGGARAVGGTGTGTGRDERRRRSAGRASLTKRRRADASRSTGDDDDRSSPGGDPPSGREASSGKKRARRGAHARGRGGDRGGGAARLAAERVRERNGSGEPPRGVNAAYADDV